ncbi:MAG: tetratricopeptide repeat protein [Rhodanobacteraceae bacterium]
MFTLALSLLLVAAWQVYKPGLRGDFLFDDFGNLPAIGATGPVDNAATLARYLTSGEADPTGRPLTLASFLMDARDWPAKPYPFKVSNVLLHLLNGALLYCVLLRLGMALMVLPSPPGRRWPEGPDEGSLPAQCSARSEPSPQALSRGERGFKIAALFGAGAWLLHPLLVSTTLYIVQREAMLPATFVLIGMFGWIGARDSLARGHIARGSVGMALAAWGCTFLAILSKGNGALLPLLLLLTEWIVLAPCQRMPSAALERRRRLAVSVLLVLPSLLIAAFLFAKIPASVRTAQEIRDWTIAQRLLSEPRALIDYLGLLFAPRAHSLGLFTDGFAAATGWLHPWTTLPCMLLVFALIGAGFALRRKHPAIALALLFYFAGQLLESTWLPLELYYEHRNYLPAMLLFWPIGIGLGSPGALRWLRAACAVGILILLGSLTYIRASLWGDGYRQAQIWAAFNPDSARAQANAAQYDLAHDRPRLAAARLRNALPGHPDDLQIPVNLIGAECRLNALRPQTLTAVEYALAHGKVGSNLVFKWFDTGVDFASSGTCRGFDFAVIQSMLDAMRRNPYWNAWSGWRQDIDHQQGMLYLAEHKPRQALQVFDAALARAPKPDAALEQAALLGAHGYPDLGLAHLEYWRTLPLPEPPAFGMPRVHAWVLERQHYWKHETARLRATLMADVAAEAKPTRRSPTPASN